ncbi:MAG: NADH-quinone oxidoreductase subunit NuoE [Chloroflexi bacterium]|nr:NADH-quinone oxidoreductase subunit NuoE [Chloroflexota bacterium]MBU1747622.1 NADH-quinone oxidoreductase subunit NuoE [Chloroflexota bacterium]
MAEALEEIIDLSLLDPILAKYGAEKGAVIPVLQQTQEIYGYLPKEVLQAVARGMSVPLSQIYGVVTFYSQFYLTRRGKHIIRQCDGTACHVRGAARIVQTMEDELGIPAGETTPDYKYTYEVVYCLGSCGLAPVAVIDDDVVGHLVPERMVQIVRDLDAPAEEG